MPACTYFVTPELPFESVIIISLPSSNNLDPFSKVKTGTPYEKYCQVPDLKTN